MTKEIMLASVEYAKEALKKDEVPIVATIVKDDQIIAMCHNTCVESNTVLAHAEINAINLASKILNKKILDDCEIYITVEPCVMCVGAILNARIKRVYYGAKELKSGAHTSKYLLLANKKYNHKVEVYDGFYQEEAKELLQEFFKNKR